MEVDRRKRRTFKIHRDYRGTPTLASRQFDMRDELFLRRVLPLL